jgi:hypothetical protein
MALTAKEEWDRLNRCINVKHYIGPRSHKVIEDAFPKTVAPKIASKPVLKEPSPSINKSDKPLESSKK